MKLVKGILIALFIFLILFNIALTIIAGATLHKMSIVVLLTLIMIFIFKKRISWMIAVCLFTYGIFYFLFISIYKSAPGVLEFTSTLNTFLFGGYTGNPLRHILHLFPFLFYTVSLIVFLTKPVRKHYNITA
jgi:hypothetical protein